MPPQPGVGPLGHSQTWVVELQLEPAGFAEQAAKQTSWPMGQVHAPLLHVSPEAVHAFPHAPQSWTLLPRFVQRAGREAVAGHWSGSDGGHWQVLVAPAVTHASLRSGQAFPQPPQFAGSFVVFTQAVGVPTGHCVGDVAGHPHAPAVQTSFVSGQGWPQPPAPAQFCASLCVSVQLVPQSSGFAPKQPQTPPWQLAPGLNVASQLVPHVPQAAASVWRSRQRGEREGQSERLPHWQAPPLHVVPVPHCTPHPPQLFGSVW